MISYELAKKLREAGFPNLQSRNDDVLLDYAESITLEELIDACGDKFSYLSKKHGGWQANSIFIVKDNVAGQEEWIGKTSLEAVANLWLALNKKV